MVLLIQNNYDRYCALYIFAISARASSDRREIGNNDAERYCNRLTSTNLPGYSTCIISI